MQRTDVLYNGNEPLTPQFAAIACNTSGNNTLVNAVTGKKIRVHTLTLIANDAVNLYFTSGAAGTVVYGGSTHKIPCDAAGSGFALAEALLGHFQTAAGEALVLNLSGAVAVSGGLTYTTVTP